MHPNRRPKHTSGGAMRVACVLALAVGIAASPGQTTHAQGFGFLFGQPGRGYGSRSPRRPRPRAVDVPLPVPRPHFPGDDATVETASPARAEVTRAPSELPPKPTSATPLEADATPDTKAKPPPLPPEKPPDLAASPLAKTSEPDRTGAKPSEIKPSDSTAIESKTPNAQAPDANASGAGASVTTKPPLPAVAPSGATNAFNPRQPTADAACPSRLMTTAVDAAPVTLAPQPDARCVVVQPVKLDHLTLKDGSRVTFPDRPTIACATADTFATYVRDLLVPLAKGTYGVALDSVWTGPGLECRSRDHIFGAKLSAHGQGLAIDIAQLKLADGRVLAVGDPKGDRDQAFETAARAAGCGYFHTVLGPGSDNYHRTHWHFDLEERGSKGDSKFCK